MELQHYAFNDVWPGEEFVVDSRYRLVNVNVPEQYVVVDQWVQGADGYGVPVLRSGRVGTRVTQSGDDPPQNGTPEKSGGSVDYYKVRIAYPLSGNDAYTAECNDIIEALGMNYAEGNALKALWRSCTARTLGKLKQGGDAVYDAEKMVFFSERVLAQRKGE